jgi:Tfp pilus assembly protein PilZ
VYVFSSSDFDIDENILLVIEYADEREKKPFIHRLMTLTPTYMTNITISVFIKKKL